MINKADFTILYFTLVYLHTKHIKVHHRLIGWLNHWDFKDLKKILLPLLLLLWLLYDLNITPRLTGPAWSYVPAYSKKQPCWVRYYTRHWPWITETTISETTITTSIRLYIGSHLWDMDARRTSVSLWYQSPKSGVSIFTLQLKGSKLHILLVKHTNEYFKKGGYVSFIMQYWFGKRLAIFDNITGRLFVCLVPALLTNYVHKSLTT